MVGTEIWNGSWGLLCFLGHPCSPLRAPGWSLRSVTSQLWNLGKRCNSLNLGFHMPKIRIMSAPPGL